jgi:hypothetical protein
MNKEGGSRKIGTGDVDIGQIVVKVRVVIVEEDREVREIGINHQNIHYC